jgi:beta-phosphoglucomutase
MIKGVIFDMDGVLLDNVEYHLEAFRLFGEEQGKSLTREDVQSVFGRKNWDMLEALLNRRLEKSEADRLADRKEELYRQLVLSELHAAVVSGLPEFLESLAKAELPMALATSGPIENVDMVFDGLGIRSSFHAIVTGDQVKHGKPHPEAFLTAAAFLDLAPEDCVVFEDSVSGVQAALSAGCKCVAVATTHEEEELNALSPDLVIQDFQDFSPDRLQEL